MFVTANEEFINEEFINEEFINEEFINCPSRRTKSQKEDTKFLQFLMFFFDNTIFLNILSIILFDWHLF